MAVKARLLGPGLAAACLLAAAWAGPAAAATGSTWQVLPTVNQQASQTTTDGVLIVSLASPADGWAVGAFDDENAVGHPLVEHWNGTSWSMSAGTSLPAGASGQLNAIGGSGPDDLWAVGLTLSADQSQESLLLEHFNGTQWQNVAFPAQASGCDPGLSDCFLDPTAVAASSPGNAWLAGNVSQPNATQHLLAHWNGTGWKLATVPCLEGTATAACDPAGTDLNELTGLTVLSPTDAWASGSGQVFAAGARNAPGQCCLRTLALRTTSGWTRERNGRTARRLHDELLPRGQWRVSHVGSGQL